MENQELITEIHIKKSRSHFAHLRRVIACIAARLGMSGKDIEETETAISTVCSVDETPDCQIGNLRVKLTTNGIYMMVEITDPCARMTAIGDQVDDVQSFECVRRLVDELEYIGSDEGSTVRLKKYAEKSRPSARKAVPHTAAAGATASQR